MGVVKSKDLIAWEDDRGNIICGACGDPGEVGKPLTKDDFEKDDIVTCDSCGERIFID